MKDFNGIFYVLDVEESNEQVTYSTTELLIEENLSAKRLLYERSSNQ